MEKELLEPLLRTARTIERDLATVGAGWSTGIPRALE
jgi:hypothetical protein